MSNQDRAEWAGAALQNFADITMGGDLCENTLTDLICDIGHFAELVLGLEKTETMKLFEIGIGAWSAERDSLDGEPDSNDIVSISIR